MRRWSGQALWYLTGFTLAALLMIAVGISYATSSYARSMHWVLRSHQVQTATEEIRSNLYSARNGRLLYVFAGRTEGLDQYRGAADALPAQVDQLRSLTSDNPAQQALVAALAPLVQQQLSLLRMSTEMAKQGGSLQSQQQVTDSTQDLAHQAFAKLESLRLDEERLLSHRKIISEKTYRTEKAFLSISFVLVLLFTILNFSALVIQLRERQNAEQVVRRLSGRILQVQDEERRKLARDLHDGIGQLFTALKMTLSQAARAQSNSPKDSEAISESLQLVEEGISQSRTLSYLLHPPMLDEIGFSAAAKWLVDGFSERSKIAVSLDIPADLKLPRDLELTLFRVLQEGLTNVHRHSGSGRAEVVVAVTSGAIVMTLRDYGKGIPEPVLQNFKTSRAPAGIGLGGMRGRVADVDGTLDLESSEQGALLRVSIPLAKNVLPAAVSSSAPSLAGTQSPSGSEQASTNSSPAGLHARDEVVQ
jgi:signal transduction histidine kinase